MLVTRLGVFDFTTGLQDGLSGDGEKEGGVREEGGLGRRRERGKEGEGRRIGEEEGEGERRRREEDWEGREGGREEEGEGGGGGGRRREKEGEGRRE